MVKIASPENVLRGGVIFKTKHLCALGNKIKRVDEVSIARALVRRPEILILDDSTSALDLATEAKLRNALNENLGDTTVIMIAQRIASVREADRIAVIENGAITACAPHDILMQTSETYRDIYNSQMKNGGDI